MLRALISAKIGKSLKQGFDGEISAQKMENLFVAYVGHWVLVETYLIARRQGLEGVSNGR
jgi:hypothetical protein